MNDESGKASNTMVFPLVAHETPSNSNFFHALVEKNINSLLVVDREGKILYANPAAEKLFFVPCGGLAGRLFGHPVQEGEVSEVDVMHSDHRKTTAEMNVTSFVWNGVSAFLLSLRAITGRRSLKESLRKDTDRLHALINMSPLAIVAVNMSGRITLWNQAAERIFGWREADMIGQQLPSTSVDDKGASLPNVIEQAIRGEALHGRELAGQRRARGGELVLQLWTSPLRNSLEISSSGVMILAADITERKRTEARLHHIASLDPLTALPNRAQFRERLRLAVDRVKQGDQPPFTVFHFGLDRFKSINQSLGHAMGDQILLEVAKRLSASLYDTDLVARTSGDEFSILLRDTRHVRDSARIAQKLLDAVSTAILQGGNEVFATASIGIAVFPHDGEDADSLLHSADTAMDVAKERGGSTFQFHTEDFGQRAWRQLHMESELHLALERKEFQLYFQPQVDVGNGRIVGVEALLRWFHPELGGVSPAIFIPEAENNGLIVPIGEWVLRTACMQAHTWAQAGMPPVRVAVNLSARQLAQPQFVAIVTAVLSECGLAPDLLDLELTESMLVKHTDEAIAVMYELKKLGVRLSIDDFGTGYSALSYLARMPLDTLKIDQSFVRGIGQGRDNGAIVLAIIALAHSLGLKTIAEGVETEAQAEFLIAHHCDEIQGYLFSPPLPAEECARLLTAEGGGHPA